MSDEITPFRIDIPQADLDDLHRRIDAWRRPPGLPGAGWEYGVEQDHLSALAAHWRDGFDWRARERALNTLPQFTTGIDGQRVHFVHLRSSEADAVPLLLTHGWPSTFADFADMAAPLAEPSAHGAAGTVPFHVVVPSVPGFGFSGPTRETGWSARRVARAWAELMRRLGYDRFLAHGGDLGAIVSPELGRIAPDRVLGVHLNAAVAPPDWSAEDPLAGLCEEDAAAVYAGADEWERRSGYAAVQSTRPHTLAYALNDSPVGMLAWNLEWFVDYDPARGVQTPVDRDALLTDASVFWFTATSGSAARHYKEAGGEFFGGAVSGVPTAVAVFPGDGAVRGLVERSNRVVRWTEYDRGGHFAALQAPDLLTADIRAFAAEAAG